MFPILKTMRVNSSVPASADSPIGPSPALRQGIQIATLKKALESQKQEAAEVLKALEPKGRVIDIRV